MKLSILNQLGKIKGLGEFTSENALEVKAHFNYLLDHYEEVVMCLAGVTCIDNVGLEVMQIIHNKAVKRNKVLFVLGKRNEKVFNLMHNHNLSYIFRNDY